MVPATQNIKVMRGDTEVFVIKLTNSDSTPVDLTGSTFASQIRYEYDSATIAATFTCAITNATGGEVTLTLSSASSSLLNTGLAYWDLQRSKVGVVDTILAGKCTIMADVTRI